MRIILVLMMCLVCTVAQAQCGGKIKNVLKDDLIDKIIVGVEFTLNGNVVNVFLEDCTLKNGKYFDSRNVECIAISRYDNTTGNDAAIIKKAEADIGFHIDALLKRIPENAEFIETEKQKRLNELKLGRTTESIILNIKSSLIGYEISKDEVVVKFKNKDIKVTYDEKNTVTDSVLTP